MVAGKRFLAGLTAASLVAAAHAVPASAALGTGCDTPHETEPTRTFQVKVSVLREVYELGQTAKFRVRVTRTVDGNAVGPAEGVQVKVGVSLDDVYLTGGATTDADGRTLVKVVLKSYAPAVLADVRVFASKQIVDHPCHSKLEYEYGDAEADNLFRVKG